METPGTDEPSQTADPDAPEPVAAPAAEPVTEPITVGDPTGGATATASISPAAVPPSPPVAPPTGPAAASAPTPPPLAPPTSPPSGPPRGGSGGSGGSGGPGGPGGPGGAPDDGGLFAGGLSGDWPAQATDAIVNVVGAVRDRTTGPITTIARGVVFGLFVAVLGLAVAVMLIIAAIRLLDEALPSGVWLAYLVLGVVVVIAGALVFRKRNQPSPAAGNTGRP